MNHRSREDGISDDSGNNNALNSETLFAYGGLLYEDTELPLLPSDLQGTITSVCFKQDRLHMQVMLYHSITDKDVLA